MFETQNKLFLMKYDPSRHWKSRKPKIRRSKNVKTNPDESSSL